MGRKSGWPLPSAAAVRCSICQGRTYRTAADRWSGVDPYYATFPVPFAHEVIREFSRPGETVLDPFAGRGTALFAAVTQGRSAVGVELNPVGYVFATAKLSPAPRERVEARLREVGDAACRYRLEAESLSRFFTHCFAPDVLAFLIAARELLDWRESPVDRTLAALLLVHLHGNRGASLSNQMRQTKSLSPEYSIRWWQQRGLTPPEVDPVAFMLDRIRWRYAKGLPKTASSTIRLGDSRKVLGDDLGLVNGSRASLLFTSPPYHDLTNYSHDQWLRLWVLGEGSASPKTAGHAAAGIRLYSESRFRSLLAEVFTRCAPMLANDACVYVRTDRRPATYEATREALQRAFPGPVFAK